VSGGGFWLGLVQGHSPDEEVNVQSVRYAGNLTRDVGTFVNGALDYTGKITYFPQDWRMLAFALGNLTNGGSPSPYTHTVDGANGLDGNPYTSGIENPFISFAFEDHRASSGTGVNFARRFIGCVIDGMDITISPGEIVSVDLSYIAQSGIKSSGTAIIGSQPVNDGNTNYVRPYIYSDFTFHQPSGTIWNEWRGGKISLKNGFEAPHYVNGVKTIGVPIKGNRDSSLTFTFDAESSKIGSLYDIYFIGGSTFNCLLGGNIVNGSRDICLTFSGCVINKMPNPLKLEGIDTIELTITPKTVTGFSTDEHQYWAFGSP
jgi:hypothetical protein